MQNIKLNYKISFRVTSLFFFIQGLIFATWASRIIDIKAALSLSEGVLGGVLFAIPAGQICAMALSAWAVNHFSSFRTQLFATIFAPICLVFVGMMDSIPTLVATLFVFGALTNLMNISVNTQGVNVEKVYNKNIMPTLHGMWSLGGFSGALLSFALSAFGLGVVAHFLTVMVFAIVVGGYFSRYLLREDVLPKKNESEETKRGLLSKFDTTILVLGVISFCAMICEGTMFDWSSIYFDTVVGVPTDYARIGYIICMSTMTLGRFIAGYFINRFGAINTVKFSGLLIAAGLALSVAFPTFVTAGIGFAVVGFGISSTVPICYSMAGKSKTMSPSSALAAVSTIGCLGFLLGPPVIGFITELITLRYTFAVVIILALSVAFLSRKIKE